MLMANLPKTESDDARARQQAARSGGGHRPRRNLADRWKDSAPRRACPARPPRRRFHATSGRRCQRARASAAASARTTSCYPALEQRRDLLCHSLRVHSSQFSRFGVRARDGIRTQRGRRPRDERARRVGGDIAGERRVTVAGAEGSTAGPHRSEEASVSGAHERVGKATRTG